VKQRLASWGTRVRSVLVRVGRAVRRAPFLSLLTPLGASALVVSLVAWAVGAAVGWIELFLAASTGLLVVAACGFFAVNRSQPTVQLDPKKRRFPVGDSTTVEVRVHNPSGVPMLPVDLEVVVGDAMEPFALPIIGGHGLWQETFPVAGARRGVIAIGPATTVRGDPLGLLERRVRWAEVSYLYVHPQTVPLALLGSGLLRDLEGRATSELSMSDLAFHTLREYSPGDDRRYIHWRSSAKALSSGGKLMVRQFQDTRRTQLLVVVDGDRNNYADPEEFELAISAGASVAVEAVDEDLDTTVLVANQHVKRRGAVKLTSQLILDACSRADHARRPFPELIADGVRQARDLTFAFLVTGSRPDFATLRRAASRVPRHVRTSVLRVAPGERAAVAPGTAVSVLTMSQLADLRGLLRRGDKI
jgi:uncharacterized protein (DUF58 family)